MDKILHKKLFNFFILSFQNKNIMFNKQKNKYTLLDFYDYWLMDFRKLLRDEIRDTLFCWREKGEDIETELERFWKQQALGNYLFISNYKNTKKNIKKLNLKITKVFKGFKTASYKKKELSWYVYGKETEPVGNARFYKEGTFLQQIWRYLEIVLKEEQHAQVDYFDAELNNFWARFSEVSDPRFPHRIRYMPGYNWKVAWIKEDDLDR